MDMYADYADTCWPKMVGSAWALATWNNAQKGFKDGVTRWAPSSSMNCKYICAPLACVGWDNLGSQDGNIRFDVARALKDSRMDIERQAFVQKFFDPMMSQIASSVAAAKNSVYTPIDAQQFFSRACWLKDTVQFYDTNNNVVDRTDIYAKASAARAEHQGKVVSVILRPVLGSLTVRVDDGNGTVQYAGAPIIYQFLGVQVDDKVDIFAPSAGRLALFQ